MFLLLYRFGHLHRTAERWPGPISLVVYLTDEDVPLLEKYIGSKPVLSNKNNLNVHLVYKEGVSSRDMHVWFLVCGVIKTSTSRKCHMISMTRLI